jgi:amino acid transporter
MVLRRTAPHLHRPLRVPGLEFLAPTAFVLATLMLYWARWPHTAQIMLLLILPLPFYLYYQGKGGWQDFAQNLRGAWWLAAYLATICVLSWAGSTEFEGRGYIPYGWDQASVALAAILFYRWGVQSGWSTPAVRAVEGRASGQ